MILPILVCIFAWNRLQGRPIQRALGMAIVAVLITGLTAGTAGSIPLVEIPVGPNQELRVMPPTAFPFTMQQYRDYDTNQFYYRIVIGWPNGLPIYEGIAVDVQSEFIPQTHLYIAVLLGEDISAGLLMSLSVLFLIEKRRKRENVGFRESLSQLFLPLFVFSVALLLFMLPHLLSYLSYSPWFRVAFWGLFVGLGVYSLSLFLPEMSNQNQLG